jgi:hypothetical protein
MTDQSVEIAGADLLALGNARVELFKNIPGDRARCRGARQDDDVAVGVGVYAKAIFNESEVAVVFPEQLRQHSVIFEGNNNTRRFDFRLWWPS